MFQSLIKSTLFGALFFSVCATHAAHRSVKLGAVSVAGTGCPEESAATNYDRNSGHLMVLPENFAAVLDDGARVARKSCSFAVSFQGVPNRAVRLTLPRIKGSVVLDQDASSEISYEVFFAGQRGERSVLTFNGTEEILETNFDETQRYEQLVFGCGASGIIRGHAAITVNSHSASRPVALAHVRKMGIKIDSIPCH